MGCGSSNQVADVAEPEAEKAQHIPSNVKQDIAIQDLELENTTSTGHLQDDKSQLIPERNLHTVEDNKNRSQDKKTRNLIDKTQIKNERNKSRSSKKAFESALSNNKTDDVNTNSNINSVKSNDEKVVKEKAEKNIIRPKEDIPLRSGKDGKQSESVPDGDTNVGSSPGGTIKHKRWTIEDTFWVGKRKLMTDIERIRLVDQHAVKVSCECLNKTHIRLPHHAVLLRIFTSMGLLIMCIWPSFNDQFIPSFKTADNFPYLRYPRICGCIVTSTTYGYYTVYHLCVFLLFSGASLE